MASVYSQRHWVARDWIGRDEAVMQSKDDSKVK